MIVVWYRGRDYYLCVILPTAKLVAGPSYESSTFSEFSIRANSEFFPHVKTRDNNFTINSFDKSNNDDET